MNEKISRKAFISIGFMLFAMFFGSGNLIFPPMLGNQAGSSTLVSLLGFAITAIVFPVLGILAVAKTDGIENLGKRVGPFFAIVYPAVVFLAIGPGIAIPRNGSLAFEMSVLPYLSQGTNLEFWRLGYTLVFFALAFYLCLQPSKLVDRIGKLMTPVLLALILLFFLGSVIKLPVNVADPVAGYKAPLVTGFLEGYNTMDTLAALNFGLVISLTIRRFKVTEEKSIIKYTSLAGLLAGILLLIIYAMLAHVGKISSLGNQDVENGGRILFNVTNQVFGRGGSIVLILIFTLSCLTTVVGLITSVSEYFARLTKGRVGYKAWTSIFTIISLGLDNFGLSAILKFSVPVLVAIYPIAIVLIILALLQDVFNFSSLSYKITIYSTFIISLLQGIRTTGLKLNTIDPILKNIPFFEQQLEWLPVAIFFLIVGVIIDNTVNRKKESIK